MVAVDSGKGLSVKHIKTSTLLFVFCFGFVFFIRTHLYSSEKFSCLEDYCSLEKTTKGFYVWHIVEQGDIHTLRVFIDVQKLIDTKNRRGETRLYRAIKQKQIQDIKFLLQAHADVHARTKMGETLFEAACTLQDQEAKENIVSLLVRSGFDVNKPYEDERTLLHTAVLNNQMNLMSLLLYYNADVNLYERYFTPLQIVIALYARVPQQERLHTIRFLLKNSNCNLNICTKDGYAPLHIAVSFCNPLLCSLLLSHKADCAVVDRENNTPLYLASLLEDSKKKKDRLDILAMLLKADCTVNMQNNQGSTPLHGAVRGNFVEAVVLLMQYDVDSTIKDFQGNTPLQVALRMRATFTKLQDLRKNMGIIKLLLENNGSVNEQYYAGVTPLHYAVLSGDESLVALFIQCGSDLNMQTNNYAWNAIPYYNVTPLVLACYKKNPILVKLLLRAGAKQNISCRSFEGVMNYSPYAVALQSGCKKSTELLLEDQLIKEKFKYGIVRGLMLREFNSALHMNKKIEIAAVDEKKDVRKSDENLIRNLPNSINFNPKKKSKIRAHKSNKKLSKK